MSNVDAPELPLTKYQWCLYVIAYPWLAMVSSSVKPGVALLGWFGWMAALTILPTKVALLVLVVPIGLAVLALAASVMLLCDREIQRYEAKERPSAAHEETSEL